MLGKPSATEEEVIAVAKSTNAHNFNISMASGYNTDIRVGGVLLSGGQQQGLAITRSFIMNL